MVLGLIVNGDHCVSRGVNMSRWLILIIVFITGCAEQEIDKEENPPLVLIEIGSENFETKTGSYCWGDSNSSTCVDKAGPVELLEEKEPIKVKPGEKISFIMDYEPKPNGVGVTQIDNNKEISVKVKNNHIAAPTKKGVYYYSYDVQWMDEKETNISHGDVTYAFVIEVD